MFPTHLSPSPEEWMRFYWGAAAPFNEAFERAVSNAFTTSATAFLPPPWNMMMQAAWAWRDMANAGYADDRRRSPTSPRREPPSPRALSAPVGIASSPAARRELTSAMPTDQRRPDAAAQQGASVVLINTFVVPVAMEEPFLNWWRMLKPAFAAQPGFVSARLHRSLDQNERYRFINIAEWESTESYRKALTSMWSSVPKPTIAGLEWHPALYEVVEVA